VRSPRKLCLYTSYIVYRDGVREAHRGVSNRHASYINLYINTGKVYITCDNESLAFTRYSFTLKLLCASQSFVHRHPPLYSPHYCNDIARPLCNVRCSPNPPCVCLHHTTLVLTIFYIGQIMTEIVCVHFGHWVNPRLVDRVKGCG